MSCVIRKLPRSGKLALRLRWVLPPDGMAIESQEATPAEDTLTARTILEKDICAPISAEMRARRFTRERYLEYFPWGAKAARFRSELGVVLTPSSERVPPATVETFLPVWLERNQPPHVRASHARDYRNSMTAYVVPYFGAKPLREIDATDLFDFRRHLVEQRNLSMKTVQNVIGGVLRAFFRDARNEGLLESYEFFGALKWQAQPPYDPDPFSEWERERIVEFYEDYKGGAFLGFVATLLFTGMRPSEATALRVESFEPNAGRLTIRKSRNLKTEAATKTKRSARTIDVTPSLLEILIPFVEGRLSGEHLFRNLKGGPLNQDHWRKDHWHIALTSTEIRDRDLYCCRDSFISIAASNGMPLLGLAQYCGTSVQMIERSYGKYLPRSVGEIATFVEGAKTGPVGGPVPFRFEKAAEIGASPTGFEPVSPA